MNTVAELRRRAGLCALAAAGCKSWDMRLVWMRNYYKLITRALQVERGWDKR